MLRVVWLLFFLFILVLRPELFSGLIDVRIHLVRSKFRVLSGIYIILLPCFRLLVFWGVL